MNAKETAQKILDESHVGTMSTVEANKPFSRYMTFFHEDFTLYTATSKKTEKVDELEKNPNTHILLGYEDEGYGDAFLEIAGKVTISDDKEMKEKVWNDHMKPWFDGPEDPNLVILKVTPESIRVMNKKGEEPQTITF
ncbi:pyridoxamine 5'-phosphate oxidase family protein [Sporosarcina aquimarina]|uniref:Pyridoxamine 5'-phosphate oxidase family protein n=1 Tax=Sporosarcina aquimarina TaxID=114975 RepID=A0ABU4FZU4_9BACL|nr:pyridoxamine 5'-phosphate oxidase family protein [Sporosarcina aquimarina]MDW0110232.1 pyridoxamine 5'-phosphate oxidase family protein [Sporosarcina aquimarina]